MDDAEEHQAELWRLDATNHLLLASHALAQLSLLDESLNKEWADSRIGFFHQTADELSPSQEKYPEYPGDNIIPITQFKRRK